MQSMLLIHYDVKHIKIKDKLSIMDYLLCQSIMATPMKEGLSPSQKISGTPKRQAPQGTLSSGASG